MSVTLLLDCVLVSSSFERETFIVLEIFACHGRASPAAYAILAYTRKSIRCCCHHHSSLRIVESVSLEVPAFNANAGLFPACECGRVIIPYVQVAKNRVIEDSMRTELSMTPMVLATVRGNVPI